MAYPGTPFQIDVSVSFAASHGSNMTKASICPVCRNPQCSLNSHREYARRHYILPPLTNATHHVASSANTSHNDSQLVQLFAPRQIENPRTDPFAHYPLQLRPEDRRLLDLWTQDWDRTHTGPSRHLFPIPVIDLTYPYAIKSPVLFRATLAMAATQWALAGGNLDELAFKQHSEAIQLHAAACQDKQAANSDENILAGICIMSMHMASGNVLAASSHMQGINTLVRTRGGPHYLGMQGIVAGYLMYADHAQSVFHMQKPVWEMPLPGLRFPPAVPKLFGAGFEGLRPAALDRQVLDLADHGCRLTELFHFGLRGQATRQALSPVGYLSMLCEYMLADIIYQYRDTQGKDLCVCLALLIFDHVVLRNVGAINPGIRMMESRFWGVVQSANKMELWNDPDDVYLYVWVLLTALSITIRAESPWQDYAVGQIRAVKAKTGLHTFEDLRTHVLDPFCWLEVAQEPAFRKLWSKL